MQGIANAGFGTFEFAGITRNLDGKSWFDRMTEHCTGQYSFGQATPQPNHGTCLYVDGDGDKVMIDWTYVMPAGTKQIVAGTGKYAGITGKDTFVNTQLKPPGEGMDTWLADVDLDFQIKSPSQ